MGKAFTMAVLHTNTVTSLRINRYFNCPEGYFRTLKTMYLHIVAR